MTHKDRELLLKDLCARLPYGVKVCAMFNTGNRYTANVTAISADIDYIQIRQNDLHPYTGSSVEGIRPYLRPMFSMTEEEKKEYFDLIDCSGYRIFPAQFCTDIINWVNEHHFDYNGLIGKGLALEAPEGMYKTE